MGKGESTYIPGNFKGRFAALGKFMHCWPNPFVKPQFWLLSTPTLSTHIVMYSLLCVCRNRQCCDCGSVLVSYVWKLEMMLPKFFLAFGFLITMLGDH